VADFHPKPLLLGILGIDVSAGMVRLLRETEAAGICLLRRNIDTPGQVRDLIDGLESEVGRRLLVAVDHDGGRRSPFARGVTFFPGFEALARTGSAELAREAARVLGRELVSMGIDLTLAPVRDLGPLADAWRQGTAKAGLLDLKVSGDLTSRAAGPVVDAVRRALDAGNDLCLLLHDEEVLRRAAAGVEARRATPLSPRSKAVVEVEDGEDLAEAIAASALQIERDPLGLIPVRAPGRAGLIVPRLSDVEDRFTIEEDLRTPTDLVRRELPKDASLIRILEVPVEADEALSGMPVDWAQGLETVVAFLVPGQRRLQEELERRCPRLIAVLMGEGSAGERNSVVRTWGFRACQWKAALRVLFPATEKS